MISSLHKFEDGPEYDWPEYGGLDFGDYPEEDVAEDSIDWTRKSLFIGFIIFTVCLTEIYHCVLPNVLFPPPTKEVANENQLQAIAMEAISSENEGAGSPAMCLEN